MLFTLMRIIRAQNTENFTDEAILLLDTFRLAVRVFIRKYAQYHAVTNVAFRNDLCTYICVKKKHVFWH